MPRTRLRRADCSGPGITRRRSGRGFAYFDDEGRRVDEEEVLQRIRELAIPPAWEEVWICPYPHGHLQATGTDAAGRKQYRYHDRWRARRDAAKHERVLEIAHQLPDVRDAVMDAITGTGLTRERVLACAVRLLDLGAFRVGSEQYAEDNGTYGLATLRRDHVRVRGEKTFFAFPAKGGKDWELELKDRPTADVVRELLKRPDETGEDLLGYWVDDPDGRQWHDVTSTEINAYLKEVSGAEITAKDFRTWNATVLAAVALAVSGQAPGTKTGRKRAEARAVKEVARYLGNTPAVCRASYIDPRVFDRFRDGITIGGVLPELGGDGDVSANSLQGAVEEAVLDLIAKDITSPALEKVA